MWDIQMPESTGPTLGHILSFLEVASPKPLTCLAVSFEPLQRRQTTHPPSRTACWFGGLSRLQTFETQETYLLLWGDRAMSLGLSDHPSPFPPEQGQKHMFSLWQGTWILKYTKIFLGVLWVVGFMGDFPFLFIL